MDENYLTGKCVTAIKTSISRSEDKYNSSKDILHTLFCGTKVVQLKGQPDEVLGLVIRTGYSTRKG
jgi:magnesium-transporting ATPase (P-type)